MDKEASPPHSSVVPEHLYQDDDGVTIMHDTEVAMQQSSLSAEAALTENEDTKQLENVRHETNCDDALDVVASTTALVGRNVDDPKEPAISNTPTGNS